MANRRSAITLAPLLGAAEFEMMLKANDSKLERQLVSSLISHIKNTYHLDKTVHLDLSIKVRSNLVQSKSVAPRLPPHNTASRQNVADVNGQASAVAVNRSSANNLAYSQTHQIPVNCATVYPQYDLPFSPLSQGSYDCGSAAGSGSSTGYLPTAPVPYCTLPELVPSAPIPAMYVYNTGLQPQNHVQQQQYQPAVYDMPQQHVQTAESACVANVTVAGSTTKPCENLDLPSRQVDSVVITAQNVKPMIEKPTVNAKQPVEPVVVSVKKAKKPVIFDLKDIDLPGMTSCLQSLKNYAQDNKLSLKKLKLLSKLEKGETVLRTDYLDLKGFIRMLYQHDVNGSLGPVFYSLVGLKVVSAELFSDSTESQTAKTTPVPSGPATPRVVQTETSCFDDMDLKGVLDAWATLLKKRPSKVTDSVDSLCYESVTKFLTSFFACRIIEHGDEGRSTNAEVVGAAIEKMDITPMTNKAALIRSVTDAISNIPFERLNN